MGKQVRNHKVTTRRESNKLDPKGWWYVRFRIYWPESQPPRLHIDLLIAHQIVAPILKKYNGEIALWRIHRRAAPDDAGHEFKFIFYSSRVDAKDIFSDFRSNRLLKKLSRNKILEKVTYDKTSKINHPNIEDTCDPNWSHFISKSWPHYIMGVSMMVLTIIELIYADMGVDELPTSTDNLVDFYKSIEVKLTNIWQREGKHAFLHHLNVLFGYQPIILEIPLNVQCQF